MSDTPETDAQLTTFTSISKLKKPFVNRTGTVSAEFARGLERERDEALLALGAIQAAVAEVLNLPRTPTTADEIRGAAQHLTTPAQ